MSKNSKADLYLDIVGLHREVTGSCILCTARFPNDEKVKFVVDCGLFQEERYGAENYTFPFDPKEISFALVTHTHIDHIGRIPKLYKDGFCGTTYTTKIASELMPIALNNTAEILSANVQKSPKRKTVVDSSIPILASNQPLFDTDNVEDAMAHVVGMDYKGSFKVHDHIEVTLFKNGHTFGSCYILVKVSYPKRAPIYALFTGDYSPSNRFFDVDLMPQYLKDLPINLITESTYGTTSKADTQETFRDRVLESLKNRETLIITVFAFGRMQEIAYELRKMQDEELIDPSIKIYSDGRLAHDYDRFYLSHKNKLKVRDFLPYGMIEVDNYNLRNMILANRECKIILTTSGMGSYGPAQIYLPYYITLPKCSIIFGGYTAENTLGRKLQEVEQGDIFNLNGIMTKKKAKVFSVTEFSSHAKQEDLIAFMRNFRYLKSVLVNHGEKTVKEAFAKKVIQDLNPKKVAILDPTNTIRLGAFGVIKSFATQDLNFNFTD